MSALHGVDHYENFPVASLLTPAPLRPAVQAIYRFARTADDIADEGNAPAAERLADLAAYRADLHVVVSGGRPSSRWWAVFEPLQAALQRHALPVEHLDALLSAFTQDVTVTRYADRAELLDYCARSANPVGRLLLHLYGVTDACALTQSDAICTALQLINFWQDLSVDLPRGRIYLPQEDLRRFGVADDALLQGRDDAPTRALVADACDWAASLMHKGTPLVHALPGRIGWELRLVVQGGLRILDKIAALDHRSILQRPTLRPADGWPILGRALRM
jgi:squalene synthase HpnC